MFLKYKPTNSLIKQARFIDENDDFYLFGADGEGVFCEEWLKKKGKKIIGFIDNDINKIGTVLNGYSIFGFDKLADTNLKIIITSIHSDQIAEQLNRKGLILGLDYITYDNIYWIDEPQFHDCIGEPFYTQFNAFKEEYFKTYNLLEDEYSKEVFTNIINYRLSCLDPTVRGKQNLPISFEKHKTRFNSRKNRREKLKLENIPENIKKVIAEQYICEPYKHINLKDFSSYDCIMDIGGFIGDSAAFFALQNPSAKIISFEPSLEGQKQIKELGNHYTNIELVAHAVWEESTILNFNENRESLQGSRIGTGETKISAVSLDDYCDRTKIAKVDFIKMDIEGAELHALKGAMKTLKRDLPDLAISIYHSPRDLWEIPQWIKMNFPEYKVYVDHTEGMFVWGTVCFATAK